MARKRSFFERLTGTINAGDDAFFDSTEERHVSINHRDAPDENWLEENKEEAQLTVDVYQTPDEIVVETIVAGVNPEDLDVSITREMVTISGSRHQSREVTTDDYFHRELFWGNFARTVVLPEEVDVDQAEATENHGMLTIRLPKLDKKRRTKLRVQSK